MHYKPLALEDDLLLSVISFENPQTERFFSFE